jgi:hypothetical protein
MAGAPEDEGRDPVPVDAGLEPLSPDLLSTLLDGHESEELDYKVTLDLATTKHTVDLALDIAAFSERGGYIVVGATDDGRPSGLLDEPSFKLLDEAAIRAKVAKYLPESVRFRVRRFDSEGDRFAVIQVQQHEHGFVVMQTDGGHGGAKGPVFRAGDVYVRRGTSSTRWRQEDAGRLLSAHTSRERERWRRDELPSLLAAFQSGGMEQRLSEAPVSTFRWDLDIDTLVNVAIEQLRRDDTTSVRLLLLGAPHEVRTAVLGDDWLRVADLLDRIVSLASGALIADSQAGFDLSLEALQLIYRLGDVSYEGVWVGPPLVDRLYLFILRRVLSLGGLAVRLRAWWAVRLLVDLPASEAYGEGFRGWLRHLQVAVARADPVSLGQPSEDPRKERLLLIAAEDAARLQWLHPGSAADDPALLTSIVQFDVLAAFASIKANDGVVDRGHFYPNFATFDTRRAVPAVDLLIGDVHARAAIAQMDDESLARAIRALDALASTQAKAQGYWASWSGFGDTSRDVQNFVGRYP